MSRTGVCAFDTQSMVEVVMWVSQYPAAEALVWLGGGAVNAGFATELALLEDSGEGGEAWNLPPAKNDVLTLGGRGWKRPLQ